MYSCLKKERAVYSKMPKVIFQNNKWTEVPEDCMGGLYLDGYLKTKLDNVKDIIKKNWDCVILIDGKERAGKSTLGFCCAWYLSDGKMTINNLAKNTDDAIAKIQTLPDKSVLFIDEGSLSFSSKDAMRTEQKKIMKILDVVGQKNLTIIIVLPSFFELNKSIACRRSKFLLHVYTDEQLERGRFTYFGEKKKRMLYEVGKKNYGSYDYPEADFIGRFTDFKTPFFEEYLKLKRDTLMIALNEDISKKDSSKPMMQIDVLFKILHDAGWTLQKISDTLAQKNVSADIAAISRGIKRVQ
jgi:hypothetical protein